MRPVAREQLAPDPPPQVLRVDVGRRRDLLADLGEARRDVEALLAIEGFGEQSGDGRDVVPLAHGVEGLVVLAKLGLGRDRVPGE